MDSSCQLNAKSTTSTRGESRSVTPRQSWYAGTLLGSTGRREEIDQAGEGKRELL